MIRDLGWTGFVFETVLEEARVKARKARLSCGYDPTMLQPGAEDDDEGGFG